MVLTTIYITRHGFRSNWTTNQTTGATAGTIRTPTGIASDVPLTAYGVAQAQELAEQAFVLQPRISRVYTSPFYRCVQTITPLWSRLRGVPLLCDKGLGEWYGKASFKHDSAPSASALQTFFPSISDATTVSPSIYGETLMELHERCAKALSALVADFDATSTTDEPESIVICSHAATIIAMGRALTGNMPDDPTTHDFDTYTCSISRFEKKTAPNREGLLSKDEDRHGDHADNLDWKGGKGVGGGWICKLNAATEHLVNGGERNWHFYGDESFVDFSDSSDPAEEPSSAGTAVGDSWPSKL